MAIYRLDDKEIIFPDPILGEADGLLAVGGDLSPKRLLMAYIHGLFPWYNELPILWWSPDPRMILLPDEFKCSKSLKRLINSGKFTVKLDSRFSRVIDQCASIRRINEKGTWINTEMKMAYKELYKLGFAHSVEVLHNNHLVGGLYGISIGGMFFGESMFHTETDASKVALFFLCKWMNLNNFKLIDCQMHTPHLESLGAKEISRKEYLNLLRNSINSRETLIGKWTY